VNANATTTIFNKYFKGLFLGRIKNIPPSIIENNYIKIFKVIISELCGVVGLGEIPIMLVGQAGKRGYASTMVMQDTTTQIAANLPKEWTVKKSEWYTYNRKLPNNVYVVAKALVTKELSTYPADYPATWCQHFDGGRSWYTNVGHFGENFANVDFLQHLLNGINFAADKNAGGCGKNEIVSILSRPNNSINTFRFYSEDKGARLFFNVLGVTKTKPANGKLPDYKGELFAVPPREN